MLPGVYSVIVPLPSVVVVVVVVCDTCAQANGAANPNAMHSSFHIFFFLLSLLLFKFASHRLCGRRCDAVNSVPTRSGRAPSRLSGQLQGEFSLKRGKERGLSLPKCAGKSTGDDMGLIILIVVILLLVGAFPTGGYGYGYRSHGILGTVLVIILILYLLGRL